MEGLQKVSGVVQNADKAPISAIVSVESASVTIPPIAIKTGVDGKFTLNLPLGSFWITAHASDGKSSTVEHKVEEDDNNIIIQINSSSE